MKSKISFKTALSLLLDGEVVALPTETVYGLAGRIDKEKTIEKIFLLKKRPSFDPLIVHCYDKKQALSYISGSNFILEKLFDFFSPGPLTIVARKNKKISSLITAGKETTAIRIPQHPVMRKVLKELNIPLAAPSANIYGKVSPVSANHVLSSFHNKVPVLDGGKCKKGLESTIVYPDKQKKKIFILRPGMVTKKSIESFIDKEKLSWTVENKKDLNQPGSQTSHYKPTVPLYILKTEKKEKEIKQFLSKKFPNKNLKQLHLDNSAYKTARKLYSQLRQFSNKKENLIFVIQKKKYSGGLWEAIWNRLDKASSQVLVP